MKRVDDILVKLYKKISMRFKTAFAAAIIFGLAAHMYMFMNKLPNFDDVVTIDSFGTTFRNGRWFLWIIGAVLYHLDFVFSLPWINGAAALILLGISAGITADLLGMESRTANTLLGGAFVVFPSWTSTFFFMFTVPYYALAVLMSVLSILLMVKHRKGMLLSVPLLVCSLGIYQAYLPFTAVFYVVILFLMLFDEKYGYLDVLKKSFLYLLNIVLGVGLYFVCMRLSLIITGQKLSQYKGVSSMGKLEFSRIPEILKAIGVNFFGVAFNNNLEISYNYVTKGMYLILSVTGLALMIWLFVSLLKKKDILKAVEAVVLAIAYVVAINAIYIMCSEGIYSLMYFSYVFLIIFPLALLDRCIKQVNKRAVVIVEYVMTFAAAAGILSYCHFANGQYVSMHLSLAQASSYYTAMVSEIKGIEGYNEDMKVVFSGVDIVDKTLYHNEIMDKFTMTGRDNALADVYGKQSFIRYYCGFNPELVAPDILSEHSKAILEDMPTYPNEGSIKILDNTVVVKLSEETTEAERDK